MFLNPEINGSCLFSAILFCADKLIIQYSGFMEHFPPTHDMSKVKIYDYCFENRLRLIFKWTSNTEDRLFIITTQVKLSRWATEWTSSQFRNIDLIFNYFQIITEIRQNTYAAQQQLNVFLGGNQNFVKIYLVILPFSYYISGPLCSDVWCLARRVSLPTPSKMEAARSSE